MPLRMRFSPAVGLCGPLGISEYWIPPTPIMWFCTLDDNGHIDTSTPDMVEKLIKVLCNKGMVDPFDNVPVEVSGASRW